MLKSIRFPALFSPLSWARGVSGTRTAHVHLSGEGERRGTGKGASAAAESAAADADEATGFIDRHTARLSALGRNADDCRLRAVRISEFYDASTVAERALPSGAGAAISEATSQSGANGAVVSTAAGEVARQPQDSAAPLALPWSGVPASMQSRAPVKQTPRNKRVAKELPTVNYSAPLSTLLAGPIRLATPPIRASKSLPAGVPRLPLDKLARDDSSPRPHRCRSEFVQNGVAPNAPHLPPLSGPRRRGATRDSHTVDTRQAMTSRGAPAPTRSEFPLDGSKGYYTAREATLHGEAGAHPRARNKRRSRQHTGQSNYHRRHTGESGAVGHMKVTPRSKQLRPIQTDRALHMTAFANSKIESLFSEIFLSGPEVSSTF